VSNATSQRRYARPVSQPPPVADRGLADDAPPDVDASSVSSPGFAAGFRVVSGLTVVSRISGLARDAACSRIFGAGPVWSAFAFAFLIPNLFRRLFGEGALSAAFVPLYAQTLKRDPAQADRYASAVLAATLAGLGLIMLIGEALILVLLTATPMGESGGLALRLTMIMLPYMPMVCATALLGGMLQCRDRFGPTASAPIVLNLALGRSPGRCWRFEALCAGRRRFKAWAARSAERSPE